jgi:NADH-quinone oxidoreductase subunit M
MLFFLLGMMYERRHSYEIADFGGLAASVPVFATMLVIAALASIGLPGTSGFVAEFLVLVGTFRSIPWIALIAATGVIFAAYYMLPMVQRTCLQRARQAGQPQHPGPERARARILLPLVALIFWIGVYPRPFLDRMEPSVTRLVAARGRGALRDGAWAAAREPRSRATAPTPLRRRSIAGNPS